MKVEPSTFEAITAPMSDGASFLQATLPYGSWPSPISAADVARGSARVAFPQIVADEVWWLQARPADAGRMVVVAAPAPRAPEDRGYGDLQLTDPARARQRRRSRAASRRRA